MKKHSETMAAVLLALIVVLVTACNTANSKERSDRLIVISPTAPASLDPITSNDTASNEIMKQVYETLFNQDFDTMKATPHLAESYQFENDADGKATRLRLFLKQGVKFHNGEEMTAADVKFSLDRAAASPVIGHFSGSIQGVEIIGDYEVLVSLKFPFAPILNNLSHTSMSIVNMNAVQQGGSAYPQNPVGSGPMKFVNWVSGTHIDLTRWDEYHGEAPRIKDITVRYISDPATALLELETGGADILVTVMPEDIRRIEANPKLYLIRTAGLRINYVGFNMQKKPFDDLNVRLAINHAIDSDTLVNSVYQGVGRPGRGPLASTVFASAANVLPQYEFDPAKARQLLSEAGYPDGFSTTIYASDLPNIRDTAAIVQNMLAQVGITATTEIIEWATYLDRTAKGEHEIYILGWTAVTGDPDNGLTIFHRQSFGSSGNRSFYSNPNVDRLLDAGRMETDTDRRRDIYIEAQAIIHAEAPWVYTQEGEITVGIRSNLKGFRANPVGLHPFWTAYFE